MAGDNSQVNKIPWLLLLILFTTSGVFAQFSIGPGGFVTVKTGGSLMIGTDLHITSNATSSGRLADQNTSGDITITGDVVVERYLTPDVWHNIASPVSSESSGCFAGTDLVYWYDESQIWNDWNFGWVWYTGATGGPLMVFRGYDVFYYTTPVTVEFNGTGSQLNTGAYTYNITNTDPAPNPFEIPAHQGWNLAGNPYPSPVDWLATSGWDKSDINDAKYIWDGANDIYTIYLGGGSPIGINGGTRFIPSNQGFWVQALNSGSIGIDNRVRLCDISGTPDYYKSVPPDYPLVSLVVSGNNRSDEVVVRFIKGTTDNFDMNYDASKLLSFVEEVPQISIGKDREGMAVNTLSEIRDGLAVPVKFQCGKNGFYRISLSERTNLPGNVQLYIKDEQEDKIINLEAVPNYTFYHNTLNNKNRFTLYFNPSGDIINNITPENYFTVYSDGNLVTVVKNTEENVQGEIIVNNMVGQVVYCTDLDPGNQSRFRLVQPSGYYIVRIVSRQTQSNYKILITN